MKYNKPFLSYEEQCDLRKARGMQGDRNFIISCLEDVGYYRLSGYWFSFQNADDSFINNLSFKDVWNLYVFDRQFRLLVFDAIERVECFLDQN